MIREYEEYTLSKETDRLDVQGHTYRVTESEDGVMLSITFPEYVDADRAGVVGYFWKTIKLPRELVLQIAETAKSGGIAKGSR